MLSRVKQKYIPCTLRQKTVWNQIKLLSLLVRRHSKNVVVSNGRFACPCWTNQQQGFLVTQEQFQEITLTNRLCGGDNQFIRLQNYKNNILNQAPFAKLQEKL